MSAHFTAPASAFFIEASLVKPSLSHSLPRFFEGNNAVADCEAREAGDGVNIQFLHDPLPVRFYRSDANAEMIGDFFIALPFRNQSQYLPFPIGELNKGPFSAATRNELPEGVLRNIWCKKRLSIADGFNGFY